MRNPTHTTRINRRQAPAVLGVPTIAIITGGSAAMSDDDAELISLCCTAQREFAACTEAASADASEAAYQRARTAIAAATTIKPSTPAGLAHKLRALGEDGSGGDDRIMRMLIREAFAVAGLDAPATPTLDMAIASTFGGAS